MTDCREQRWLFQELGNRKVEVDFGGGYLSSDGGGLILREVERHSGLLRDFSECFIDYRARVISNTAFRSFSLSLGVIFFRVVVRFIVGCLVTSNRLP